MFEKAKNVPRKVLRSVLQRCNPQLKENQLVNDAPDSVLCTVKCASFDARVTVVRKLGLGGTAG